MTDDDLNRDRQTIANCGSGMYGIINLADAARERWPLALNEVERLRVEVEQLSATNATLRIQLAIACAITLEAAALAVESSARHSILCRCDLCQQVERSAAAVRALADVDTTDVTDTTTPIASRQTVDTMPAAGVQ